MLGETEARPVRMVTIGEKYVERVEKALVETMLLVELDRQAGLTLQQLVPRIRAIGFDEKVDEGLIQDSLDRLDRDGHVEDADDRYRITDDGREDVAKVERMIRSASDRVVANDLGERTTPLGGTTRPF